MKIVTIGSGNVGGGLGDRWERAGHKVVRVGRAGGDAVASVTGLDAVPVIDATNDFDGSATPEGFDSLAAYVKSLTRGPVAKSFNLNFARIYDQIENQRVRPSSLYCADEE